LPELSPTQLTIREEVRADIRELATTVGIRNAASSLPQVLAAQNWIEQRLRDAGIDTRLDKFDINGPIVANIESTILGAKRPNEIVLLGAHYDTVSISPGANDNASGVAALLAIARRLHNAPLDRTVKLVFFVNEESPFSFGHQMGSRVYAKRCKERGDNIAIMICLDSIGCYSHIPGSQKYPPMISWLLPSTGNFIGFCSDMRNRSGLDHIVALFREKTAFPSLGVALDSSAVKRSDHASFWEQGYPAVLISDTSDFRDPNYHQRTDTPEKLDYDGLARVCDGLLEVMKTLASVENQQR